MTSRILGGLAVVFLALGLAGVAMLVLESARGEELVDVEDSRVLVVFLLFGCSVVFAVAAAAATLWAAAVYRLGIDEAIGHGADGCKCRDKCDGE